MKTYDLLKKEARGTFLKIHVDWIRLLVENKNGDINVFKNFFLQSNGGNVGKAMCKYRKYLLNTVELDVTVNELQDTYNNKDFDGLKQLLEKMFLEPILFSEKQLKRIFKNIDIIKLYELHIENRCDRFPKIYHQAMVGDTNE